MDEQPQDVAWSESDGERRAAPGVTGESRSAPALPGHMTVKETQAYLAQQGHNRNERTIRKYCSRGDLTCIKVDTDNGQQQHLVEIASADLYIAQQNQVYKTGVAHNGPAAVETEQETDTTASARPEPETPAPPAGGSRQGNERQKDDDETADLRAEVANLKATNRDLEIANRYKDELIKRFDEDRVNMMDRLEDRAHTIGRLEAQVKAIEAPKNEAEHAPGAAGEKGPSPHDPIRVNVNHQRDAQ